MSSATAAVSRLVVIHDDGAGSLLGEQTCTCLLCFRKLPYAGAASHVNSHHTLKAPDIRDLFARHGDRLQLLLDRLLNAILQRDRGAGEKAWSGLCHDALMEPHIFPGEKDKDNKAREIDKRLRKILATGFDHEEQASSRRGRSDDDYPGEQSASRSKRRRVSALRAGPSQDSDVIVIDDEDAPGPSTGASVRYVARPQQSHPPHSTTQHARPVPTQPVSLPAASHATLLPPGYIAGAFLMMPDFCRKYHVANTICITLEKDGWAHTDTLEYLPLEKLGTLGLKNGEIAQVLGAVKRWAVPKPVGSGAGSGSGRVWL